MGVEGGQDVQASVDYDGRAGKGSGVLSSISIKQVLVERITSPVSEDKLYLSFRVFETSTPMRIASRVVQASQDGFCAELAEMQPVTRNILRMVLVKLKTGGPSVRSMTSLLKD